MKRVDDLQQSGPVRRRARWRGVKLEVVSVPTGIVIRAECARGDLRLIRIQHLESRTAVLDAAEAARRRGGGRASQWLAALANLIVADASSDAEPSGQGACDRASVVVECVRRIHGASAYSDVASWLHRARRALGARAVACLLEALGNRSPPTLELVDGDFAGLSGDVWDDCFGSVPESVRLMIAAATTGEAELAGGPNLNAMIVPATGAHLLGGVALVNRDATALDIEGWRTASILGRSLAAALQDWFELAVIREVL